MTPTRVAVVLPVYNGARYLGAALDSVLAQDPPPHEIIVVDDGSTDDSADVAERFDRGVRLVRAAHGGVSAARNRGVAETSCDVVAFLDADDTWLPGKLKAQVEALEARPETVSSFTAAVGVDVRTGAERYIAARQTDDPLAGLLLLGPIVGGGGSTAAIRKAAFIAAGGFDETLANGEDWDLWLRLAQQGPFSLDERPLVRIMSHGGNASRNVRRAEPDNRRVLDKFFAQAQIEPRYARLRGEAYGNHYLRAAGSYLDAGDHRASVRCITLAIRNHPAHLVRILLTPWRRIRRARGAGRAR